MSDFPSGVAVVFGGSGGVGSAVCERLAFHGADLALTYFGNQAAAEATAAEARKYGRRVSVHRLDVTNDASIAAFLAEAKQTYGRVHTIVHAVGSTIGQPRIADLDPAEFRRVMDADVHGFFSVVHSGLPLLREGGGSFVYLSSAGLVRYPTGDILSVAPKAAIEQLLRGIAREEGRFGVRANSVALGVIEAGMFPKLVASGQLSAEWLDAAKRNIALRRFGSGAEVGEAVAFLASSRASYVTGQRLMLDGGYSV
jgi:NAD(P)-dependent dehydrogenase (short-subunit alcohol dehydrogenase family)